MVRLSSLSDQVHLRVLLLCLSGITVFSLVCFIIDQLILWWELWLPPHVCSSSVDGVLAKTGYGRLRYKEWAHISLGLS